MRCMCSHRVGLLMHQENAYLPGQVLGGPGHGKLDRADHFACGAGAILPQPMLALPQVLSGIQTGTAKSAAFRFVHRPAWNPCPRDPRGMRIRLRTCLAAHERLCARRRCVFHLGERGTPPLTRKGVRSRTFSPCPSHGWAPPSPAGSEDLPERQERQCEPRCACPCLPTRACLGSKSPRAHATH